MPWVRGPQDKQNGGRKSHCKWRTSVSRTYIPLGSSCPIHKIVGDQNKNNKVVHFKQCKESRVADKAKDELQMPPGIARGGTAQHASRAPTTPGRLGLCGVNSNGTWWYN